MKQQKEDRRSQRTYHLVSSAFIELLVENHYDAITVQDILDRAGIGRSTFYTHYFDKADALEQMMEQTTETLSHHLCPRPGAQGIVPSLELFRHVHQHHQIFQALVRHAGAVFWETMQATLSRAVEQVLESTLPATLAPSVPLAAVSVYLAGAFVNLLKWWLSAEVPYTPEQVDHVFQQLVMAGVWTTIGGKRA